MCWIYLWKRKTAIRLRLCEQIEGRAPQNSLKNCQRTCPVFQSPSHLMFFRKVHQYLCPKNPFETLGGGNSAGCSLFVAPGRKCKRPALKCCHNDHPGRRNGGTRSLKLYGRCCLRYCCGRFLVWHISYTVFLLFSQLLVSKYALLREFLHMCFTLTLLSIANVRVHISGRAPLVTTTCTNSFFFLACKFSVSCLDHFGMKCTIYKTPCFRGVGGMSETIK